MRAPPAGQSPIAAIALVLTPAAVVLAVFAAAGDLAWPAAAAGLVAAAAIAGVILRWHLQRVATLRQAIEVLGRDIDAQLPVARRTPLCPGLETAVAEMARQRRLRRREIEAVVAGGEAVLAALPDPLLLLNSASQIVRANPAAAAAFDGALSGRDLFSIVRNPALLAAVDAVVKGADSRIVELASPGPVVRHFSAHLARLPAPAADGTVAVLALHDVTAIKRAEQMRADFVANASHELRTPLTSLLGFIETLQGPARQDAQARDRFLGIMREQAERMSRLVKDLLSLSRIELHEHTPPHGTTDIAALLHSVARTLEPQAREKGMTIAFDLAAVPAVPGDADDLAQVFQNLLDNAIKYGRAGTEIRVSARPVAAGSAEARRLGRPGVAISVADRGEGIAHEHLPRLTERFYRVDTARSRTLGGTGLGLAIVKHILNRHRAILEIASTPGKGSVFTALLPRAAGPRPDDTTPA